MAAVASVSSGTTMMASTRRLTKAWTCSASHAGRHHGGMPPTENESEPVVHSRSTALALLALVSIVWGIHWVVVKIGLDYLPPMTYGALRIALGLATVVAIAAGRGRLR